MYLVQYDESRVAFYSSMYRKMLKEKRINNELIPYEGLQDYIDSCKAFLDAKYWDDFFNRDTEFKIFGGRINRH